MNNTTITIRHAISNDAALLADIGRTMFHETFAADNSPENMAAYLDASFSPAKQAAELAEPGSLFLIAELDGQVAGYARLKEGPAPAEVAASRPIEIVRIYAGRAWQGRGVGAALMQACLDEARERNCDAIWLGVWERNPRALAFYRKWGFVQVGTQTFKLGDDLQTDFIFQRPVDASANASNYTVMATLVTKLSFVTRVAISGVWLTSHTGF
jgi:GNAT superfamily N-acetyltransferase